MLCALCALLVFTQVYCILNALKDYDPSSFPYADEASLRTQYQHSSAAALASPTLTPSSLPSLLPRFHHVCTQRRDPSLNPSPSLSPPITVPLPPPLYLQERVRDLIMDKVRQVFRALEYSRLKYRIPTAPMFRRKIEITIRYRYFDRLKICCCNIHEHSNS